MRLTPALQLLSPLALISEEDKALLDTLDVRDDGALTINGVPVDKASGLVSGVVVDFLPTEGLFPGLKCIMPNSGTYYFDARRQRRPTVERGMLFQTLVFVHRRY